MDKNYNQQDNYNQQGSSYQQGNPYQQGGSYQQGNPYQQGGSYQQGNPYQQGGSYQQGNPYQQGGPYQQGNPYQQGGSYQQGNLYQQGNPYQQGNQYQQNNSYMNNGYGNNGGSYNYDGNSESQKAPNIFQQFALSFIPTKYDSLTRVKTGSMIGFVTLLALVATLISFISLAIGFSSIDMKGWVNELPDFEVKNGRMFIEEDFMYDEGIIFVYMTEDISEFTYEDAAGIADEGYQDIILAGQDRISIMQNGEYQQFDFRDLGDSIEISRDWIVDTFMPIVVVVIILVYVFFFVGRVLWYFLCAAVYLLFAMLIASIMKKQLSAGALFRVAVYSKVLMFVVATLLSEFLLASISIPFIVRVGITLVFMGFAIAKLPDYRR